MAETSRSSGKGTIFSRWTAARTRCFGRSADPIAIYVVQSSGDVDVTDCLRRGVGDDALIVDLVDGRTISDPIAWVPRLAHGAAGERNNLRLIARVKEFTGRTWTRRSASKASFLAAVPGKARSHSSAGFKPGYRRSNHRRAAVFICATVAGRPFDA